MKYTVEEFGHPDTSVKLGESKGNSAADVEDFVVVWLTTGTVNRKVVGALRITVES